MSDTALAIRAVEEKPDFAAGAVKLASPRLGAGVIYVTDEFLLRANACSTMHRRCSTQTAMRTWQMDGRLGNPTAARRRERLLHPATGREGNNFGVRFKYPLFHRQPAAAGKDRSALTDTEPDDSTEWVKLIEESDLAPDSPNLF